MPGHAHARLRARVHRRDCLSTGGLSDAEARRRLRRAPSPTPSRRGSRIARAARLFAASKRRHGRDLTTRESSGWGAWPANDPSGQGRSGSRDRPAAHPATRLAARSPHDVALSISTASCCVLGRKKPSAVPHPWAQSELTDLKSRHFKLSTIGQDGGQIKATGRRARGQSSCTKAGESRRYTASAQLALTSPTARASSIRTLMPDDDRLQDGVSDCREELHDAVGRRRARGWKWFSPSIPSRTA